MATFEAPTGEQDFAAQADQAELEEALALVRQRRAAAEVPAGEVQVIDPDGGEYEVDAETGAVLLDDDGEPVKKWPHETVEIRGRKIQIRAPKPTALQAFTMATAKGVPAAQQNQAIAQIVRRHISAKSFAELQEAMMDPDDEFTMDDFQALLKEIATRGTGRPTGPSRT